MSDRMPLIDLAVGTAGKMTGTITFFQRISGIAAVNCIHLMVSWVLVFRMLPNFWIKRVTYAKQDNRRV